MLQKSNSNYKMFFFLLGAKENQTPLKRIYRYGHFSMVFDDFPSFFHFGRPMNIVKNPNSFVGDGWQQQFEIVERGGFGVVAVEVDKLKVVG